MTPEELGQFLDQIGNRVGPAGQHVFEIAVRQQATYAVVGLLFAGLWCWFALIVTLYFVKRGFKETKLETKWVEEHPNASEKQNPYYESYIWYLIALIPLGCLALPLFLIIPDKLIVLLNPEYNALIDILSHLPGAK